MSRRHAGQGTLVLFSMKCCYYENKDAPTLKKITEKSNESSFHKSNKTVVRRIFSGTSSSNSDNEENEPIYESAKELDIKSVKSLS